jgi:UDP-N-acetylmuramate dehydrogenase
MNICENIGLSDKNTFRIGGLARYYFEPSTEKEIIDAVQLAQDKNLEIFLLGCGSNVLISDNGWNGLVLNLSEKFSKIEWCNNISEVQGGASLNIFINHAIARSLAGAEELSGIPGTIGGAVIMNAGAFNTSISDIVQEVRFFDHECKEIKTVQAAEMEFGYRKSMLQQRKATVLSAKLKLQKLSSNEGLIASRLEILSRRKAKQPLEYPNCGSVFKRPPGGYAGTLIEQCGLKGFSIGDVEVSQKHANFIINKGMGTANDVRKLIAFIQKKVYEEKGVLLEPEVIFVGEYDEPLFEVKYN